MATRIDEEIIEKGPSSPVATTCLILSALALIGAFIFQALYIAEVRAHMTRNERRAETPAKAAKVFGSEITNYKNECDRVIAAYGGSATAQETPEGGEDSPETDPSPEEPPADEPIEMEEEAEGGA